MRLFLLQRQWPLLVAVILAIAGFTERISAQPIPKPRPDAWVERSVALDLPERVAMSATPVPVSAPARFESLRAEAIAGKLRIYWPTSELDTNRTVTLWSSADDTKKLHARDWRPFPMSVRGRAWETSVPIDNVDVPLVYFVEVNGEGTAGRSGFRQCIPRGAGLEEPSRIFWPFLEGFEDDILSWRMLSDNGSTMSKVPEPKDGKYSLSVKLPEGRRSVTIATTRVRGWQIDQQTANGIRIWMRTVQGNARVRFTFHANTAMPNQTVVISPEEPVLTPSWQAVDVPFKSLPSISLGEIDLVSMEFISIGPAEFLIDNLLYLGRWKLEREK